jgi:methyl-accepting chemotaxis protein
MIAGIILLSSLYQYWVQKKVTAEWSRDRAQAEIRLLANDVSTVLKGVTRDLFMLRDLPQLREFLEAKSENYKKRTLSETEKFFVLFARNKKIYDQVRFINEKGREVVRVNFRGEGVEAVRKESLQDKSSRYYFQETISLVPGNVYVSPMDLNIEKGVIERPLKPMIRYATPVTNQEGEKRGIVILNVKAEHILNIIREHQQRARYGERYFLVSRLGYYLFHPDARKAWGFMFGTDNKLVNDEPGLYPLLREQSQGFTTLYNDSLKKDYFYVYQRIYPVTGESNYGVTTVTCPHMLLHFS